VFPLPLQNHFLVVRHLAHAAGSWITQYLIRKGRKGLKGEGSGGREGGREGEGNGGREGGRERRRVGGGGKDGDGGGKRKKEWGVGGGRNTVCICTVHVAIQYINTCTLLPRAHTEAKCTEGNLSYLHM